MNRKYFDDLLKERKMSMRALARRLKMNPSQLSLTFSDQRRMQLGEAVHIAQILGVPLADVAFHAGIDVARMSMTRARVTGFMGEGGYIRIAPDRERTSLPQGLPLGTTAIQCRTEGTDLSWMDGWMLFVGPARPPTHLFGRFCVITLDDGRRVVGTLPKGYRPGSWVITGPYSSPGAVIVEAAPVISIRN